MSGRIRTIKPEVNEDDKTASLDDHTWRLFVGMWVLADDYGNMRGAPEWLHGQVFWRFPEKMQETRESLATLSRLSLVTIYEVGGQTYLSVTNWARHQRVDKPGRPRVPGPKDGTIIGRSEDSRESREPVASDSGAVRETPEFPAASRACAGPPTSDLRPPSNDRGAQAREEPPPPDGSAKVPCPKGLQLTPDQRATLETAMVPDWAIDALTLEAVAGFQGDPDDHRPLAAWRKCLARAVSGRWSDPQRRRELLDARGAAAPARPAYDPAELARLEAICDAADAADRALLFASSPGEVA